LLNYSTTLKMEAIRSSETSGTTQRTTRRHIPEGNTLQNHRCENLKPLELVFALMAFVLEQELGSGRLFTKTNKICNRPQ
jgi:hypothetical protein